MNPVELVSEESRLAEVIDQISSAQRVAFDIESNGFFRYHERVCLVQLATAEAVFLVDPLAIDDIRPLGDLLGDRSVEKVFHAADYDLRSFDRDWKFRVNNLFDTSIAAALDGTERLGLQSVVRKYAGEELEKNRKLQRSDWTMRPLSSEALKYAANDVLHLLKVREALSARLKELSRFAWVKEEFARLENVRHTPPDRELAFLSVKGSRDLDGKGLAVLCALCQFREREAKLFDRPLFKVIQDSVLVQLSSEPASDLSTVKGLGRYGRRPANRRLKAAIHKGLSSQPVTPPRQTRSEERWCPSEREKVKNRLQSLKTWRNQLGRELRLDSSLLWSTVSLNRLARNPGDLHSELVRPEVRSWQKREFGASLKSVLATLR